MNNAPAAGRLAAPPGAAPNGGRVTDLTRFVRAQDAGGAYAAALAEIQVGRKTGHWIWFVFPQLAGLGSSEMSRRYALDDLDDAVAYLRHPVLLERLLTVTGAVARQVEQGIGLGTLMGSDVDATKLVSSLTLFEAAAARRQDASDEADADGARLVALAHQLLEAAAAEGYPRCRYTLAGLRG